MEKILRKYTSHEEMKADEYRYWQSRPVHERMDAVSELSTVAFALHGVIEQRPRSQWPVVVLERPKPLFHSDKIGVDGR